MSIADKNSFGLIDICVKQQLKPLGEGTHNEQYQLIRIDSSQGNGVCKRQLCRLGTKTEKIRARIGALFAQCGKKRTV